MVDRFPRTFPFLALGALALLACGCAFEWPQPGSGGGGGGAASYTVTVSSSPAYAGSVTGGGTYPVGAVALLTASPNYGYHFSRWAGGHIDTVNPTSLTVNQNLSVIALFAPNLYTILTTVSPPGAGTVSAGGTYAYLTTLRLAAIANFGYAFSAWTGAGGTYLGNDNPMLTPFAVNMDETITAQFR